MVRMKRFFLSVGVCLSVIVVNAQNSIRLNSYLQDMQYYNPAAIAVGPEESMQTSLYGKYKWVENEGDIWKKPGNIWLSHAGRIGSSPSFYTLSYVNDRYSFFSRNTLYLGYARRLKTGNTSFISYSGRIVVNGDAINWEKLKLPHTRSGRTIRFSPDLDLGIAYQSKRFNAGIGVKNSLSNTTKLEGATLLKNHREINVHLSYQQPIGQQFAITPFLLLARERNTMIDAGMSLSFFNTARVSYALRVNELKSVIAIDVDVAKRWSIGAAYDRSSLVSDHNLDLVLRYRR